LQETHEFVTLILRDVLYRDSKFQTLEEFLLEKYKFKAVEEEESEISRSNQIMPIDRKQIVFKEEIGAPIVSEEIERKYSSLKIFEGKFLDAEIRIYVMGDVIRTEDIIEVGEEERYPIYTDRYKMIKLVSRSGYVLQQLIERISIDLGLKIGSKEWFFHKCEEA